MSQSHRQWTICLINVYMASIGAAGLLKSVIEYCIKVHKMGLAGKELNNWVTG